MMSAFLVGIAIWLLVIGSSMTSDVVVFLLGGWWWVLQHSSWVFPVCLLLMAALVDIALLGRSPCYCIGMFVWIVLSVFWVQGRVFFCSPGVFCPFSIGVYFLVLFGPHRSVFPCWSLLHTLCILLSCWWMVVVVFLL